MTNYEKFKTEQLKDPELKKEYDNLAEEYKIIKDNLHKKLNN